MKVAVLFDNFGPYHLARLSAASAVMEVLAVEFGSKSGEYAWVAQGSGNLRHAVVNTEGASLAMPATAFRTKLLGILSRFAPDVVLVPGWSNRGGFMAMAWAADHQVPIVLMSESTAWDETRVIWKEWIKRRLVGLASAALVGGHPHADYIRQLGMQEEQVFLGYDAVDNSYFAAESEKWRAQLSPVREQKELVAEWGGVQSEVGVQEAIDSESTLKSQPSTRNLSPYFLTSNRFIEKKNLFRLLEAYASYGREVSDGHRPPLQCWDLVMLGDGELKEKLLVHCETLGLSAVLGAPWEHGVKAENGKLKTEICKPTVYFPGFRQINELPRFYVHAGALVHASTTEQWGLVVNEAMASGLPVIVSNRVGCARDLVQEGVNGFTFDPYDVEQLTSLLGRTSAFHFPLSTFGAASRTIISNWGPERFASGLQAAAEHAAVRPLPSAGLLDRAVLKFLINR